MAMPAFRCRPSRPSNQDKRRFAAEEQPGAWSRSTMKKNNRSTSEK